MPVMGVERDACHIYMLQAGGEPLFKIGISKHPRARKKEIQVGSPFEVLVVDTAVVQNRKIARALEKAIHNAFWDRRIRGEWFELGRDDVFAAMSVFDMLKNDDVEAAHQILLFATRDGGSIEREPSLTALTGDVDQYDFEEARQLVEAGLKAVWGENWLEGAKAELTEAAIVERFGPFMRGHLDAIKRTVDRRPDLSEAPLAVFRRFLAFVGVKLGRRRVCEDYERFWLYFLDGAHLEKWQRYARARDEEDR